MLTEHTTLLNNSVAGTAAAQLLLTVRMPAEPWAQFVATLSADFQSWQAQTGQDAHSSAAKADAPAGCQQPSAFLPLVGAARL